jgi:hypothetical protein
MNYIKRAENTQYATEDGPSGNIMLLNNIAGEPGMPMTATVSSVS